MARMGLQMVVQKQVAPRLVSTIRMVPLLAVLRKAAIRLVSMAKTGHPRVEPKAVAKQLAFMARTGLLRVGLIGKNLRNEEARSIKAGFCRERRYANLGHLLPIVYFGRAVKPGVSALPVR